MVFHGVVMEYLLPADVPFVIRGKPAPVDFETDSCIYSSGVESCKITLDRIHHAIGLWSPTGRASSSLHIYKGTCLEVGCILQNPDAGYPEKYRGTSKIVSWSGESGGLVLSGDNGYQKEILYDFPLSVGEG